MIYAGRPTMEELERGGKAFVFYFDTTPGRWWTHCPKLAGLMRLWLHQHGMLKQ